MNIDSYSECNTLFQLLFKQSVNTGQEKKKKLSGAAGYLGCDGTLHDKIDEEKEETNAIRYMFSSKYTENKAAAIQFCKFKSCRHFGFYSKNQKKKTQS